MMAMEGCMLVDTLYSFFGSQTEGPLYVMMGKALSTPFPLPIPSFLYQICILVVSLCQV